MKYKQKINTSLTITKMKLSFFLKIKVITNKANDQNYKKNTKVKTSKTKIWWFLCFSYVKKD